MQCLHRADFGIAGRPAAFRAQEKAPLYRMKKKEFLLTEIAR
jgi:hypothetical protein